MFPEPEAKVNIVGTYYPVSYGYPPQEVIDQIEDPVMRMQWPRENILMQRA